MQRIARWRQRTADRKGGSLMTLSRGGVRRRPGFTPPGAAAPGNSWHLGCLITVYPFAQWRERVNRYICIYSVYVDKDLLLCYTENANK